MEAEPFHVIEIKSLCEKGLSWIEFHTQKP
jgi:hypothetical protein